MAANKISTNSVSPYTPLPDKLTTISRHDSELRERPNCALDIGRGERIGEYGEGCPADAAGFDQLTASGPGSRKRSLPSSRAFGGSLCRLLGCSR